ncbi:MAG: hypothetical protein IPP68_03005 [Elusimicrobia bacterium]|nr:hypothetical protein [Elusimicrobiota bacterium]
MKTQFFAPRITIHSASSAILVLVAALLTGCATIVKGRSVQDITINTVPSKALVTIFDQKTKGRVFQGETPVTAKLNKSRGYFDPRQYRVLVQREGYADNIVDLYPTVSGWYVGGNVLLGGLIGWMVADPASGAMWNLSPETIEIDLDQATLANPMTSTPSVKPADARNPTSFPTLETAPRKTMTPFFEAVFYKSNNAYGNHVKVSEIRIFQNGGDTVGQNVSFETGSGVEYKGGIYFPVGSGHTQVGWACGFVSGPRGHWVVDKWATPSGNTTRVDGIYRAKYSRVMGLIRRDIPATDRVQFHLQGAGGGAMGEMKGSLVVSESILPSPSDTKNFEGSWFGPTFELSGGVSFLLQRSAMKIGVVYSWFPEKSEDEMPFLNWHPVGLKVSLEF